MVPLDHGPSANPTAEDSQQRGVACYQDQLRHLLSNYRYSVLIGRSTLGFNDTLTAGAQALNPRAKRKPIRRRINPELEVLMIFKAAKMAKTRGSNSGLPNKVDINAASAEIIAEVTVRRGRPVNLLLAYHVQAYMALHRQTCGKELRAGLTRNGDYAPHITSPIQDVMVGWFRSINPRVTVGTIAEIVMRACRSRVTEGKRFTDFFPFYGGRVDPATGYPLPGPGFRLDRFDWVAPIYSS